MACMTMHCALVVQPWGQPGFIIVYMLKIKSMMLVEFLQKKAYEMKKQRKEEAKKGLNKM